MRILIAGASGAIGRSLVRRLRAYQHEVKRRIWSEFLPSAEPVMAENGRIPAEIHKMPPGHSSFHTAWTLKRHSQPRQRRSGPPKSGHSHGTSAHANARLTPA